MCTLLIPACSLHIIMTTTQAHSVFSYVGNCDLKKCLGVASPCACSHFSFVTCDTGMPPSTEHVF